MGIFGTIMDKIFHHPSAAGSGGTTQPAPAAAAASPQPTAASPTPAATPGASVDVGAVLAEMASMKDGGGNYQSSIVDLLKLLNMDSSLSARTELASELNVHVGGDGTAEENIALHKAVMDKLAENGGVIPDSLKN